MKQIFLAALIAVLFTSSPAVAKTTGKAFVFQPILNCDTMLDSAQEAVQSYDLALTTKDTDTGDYHQYQNQGAKWYKDVVKQIHDKYACKTTGTLLAVKGYILTAQAYNAYLNSDSWASPLEQANQALEQCTTYPKNYGEKIGADCEVQMRANIKHQTEWEMNTPTP